MKLDGQYIVMFKHPNSSIEESRIESFRGVCENFIPTGICAFSNNENKMLVVDYKDIIQMKPIKE